VLLNVFLDWIKYRAKHKVQAVRTTAGVKAGSALRSGINRGVEKGMGVGKKGAKGAAAAKKGAGGAAKQAGGAAKQAGGTAEKAGGAGKKASKAQEQKVGLFNKKGGGDGEEVLCPNGHPMDPSWNSCPYCADQGGQMGGPMGGGPIEKTMAIRIDVEEPLEVVGWIVALSGNHRGQDFRLNTGKNVIGTAADCQIVVTDPYLSSKHSTIRHDARDGSFTIIDLDSTNGVYVNDKRISKDELIDNDTIRLGRTEFKFKALF